MDTEQDKKVEIYVCFHDLKQLPDIKKIIKGNDIYKLILLGENTKSSNEYCIETEGDNIAYLNPFISEMSGIYWICKNSDADIIGLVHYRRYFVKRKYFGRLIDKEYILKNLKNNDLLIHHGTAPLRGTNHDVYGDETLNDAFGLLKNMYPEYIDSYNEVINSEYPLSFFNMFVANRDIINEYIDWVIPLLEELSRTSDVSENPRMIGVIGEFLFNVYIHHNNLKFKWVHLKFYGNLKLKLRMIISKIGVVRFFFKNIYYPIKKKF